MQSKNGIFKFLFTLSLLILLALGAATAPIGVFRANASPLAQDPPTGINLSKNSIAENNQIGDLIGTLEAVDPDAGDTFTFTLIPTFGIADCSGNAAFAISGTALNAAVRFNFEAQSTYPICVEVTDSALQTYDKAFTIQVTDANDPPVITLLNTPYSIPENSAPGTPVVADTDIVVTDEDVPTQTLTISEGDPATNLFDLSGSGTTRGVIVQESANYESLPAAQKYIDLMVSASDGTDTTTLPVRINVTNVNEAPTYEVHGVPPFSINENSSSAVRVKDALGNDVYITFYDEDSDTMTLTEYAYTSPNYNSWFSYSPSGSPTNTSPTKYIVGSGGADYEALPQGQKYILYGYQINDKHGGIVTMTPMTIYINDVNEPPSLSCGSHSIAENSAPGSLVSNPFSPTDPENDPITISLINNANNTFKLDAGNNLAVVDNSLLDYESSTNPTHKLTVTFRISDGINQTPTDVSCSISITNVNEPPVLDLRGVSIRENSLDFDTSNKEITATDPEKSTLTYTTPDQSDCNKTPFTITSSSNKGVLTIRSNCLSAINHEVNPTFNLTVTVTDSGKLTDTQTFLVTVVDVNEAISIVPNQVFYTGDSSDPGLELGAVLYDDPDEVKQPTFTVLPGGTGTANFGVRSTTGQIYVITSQGLNFYTNPTLTLNVLVTDNGSGTGDPAMSDTKMVTIQLTDQNDPPVFVPNNTLTIAENAANLTTVGTVHATDIQGNNIAYSITDGTGKTAFSIDATTGLIRVADSAQLDYEGAANHILTLTVKATDDGTPSLSSTYTYSIHLTDVQEAPIFHNSTMSIYEMPDASTIVGTADLHDPDADDTLTVRITGGTGANYFDIDNGGVVTVKAGATPYLAHSSTPYTLQVTATDNHNAAATGTITIFITSRADPAVKEVITAPEIVIGSSMKYEITISNEGEGASSMFTLDLTLPASVSFMRTGSTEGCAMKSVSLLQCAGVILNPKGTSGDTKHYTINAYLSNMAGDLTTVSTKVEVKTDTNDNPIDKDNNWKNAQFIARKSVTITNQTFEDKVVEDFYRQNSDGSTTPLTSANTITTTNPNDPDDVRIFIGAFGNDTIVFQKDNLLPHSRVTVTFDLNLGHTWWGINTNYGPNYWKLCQGPDCEKSTDRWLLDTTFSTYVENTGNAFMQNYPYSCAANEQHPCITGSGKVFAPNTGSYELNVLGFTPNPASTSDTVYRMKFGPFDSSDSTLILKFLGQNLTNQIWGIDNVKIYISGKDSFTLYIPFVRR